MLARYADIIFITLIFRWFSFCWCFFADFAARFTLRLLMATLHFAFFLSFIIFFMSRHAFRFLSSAFHFLRLFHFWCFLLPFFIIAFSLMLMLLFSPLMPLFFRRFLSLFSLFRWFSWYLRHATYFAAFATRHYKLAATFITTPRTSYDFLFSPCCHHDFRCRCFVDFLLFRRWFSCRHRCCRWFSMLFAFLRYWCCFHFRHADFRCHFAAAADAFRHAAADFVDIAALLFAYFRHADAAMFFAFIAAFRLPCFFAFLSFAAICHTRSWLPLLLTLAAAYTPCCWYRHAAIAG